MMHTKVCNLLVLPLRSLSHCVSAEQQMDASSATIATVLNDPRSRCASSRALQASSKILAAKSLCCAFMVSTLALGAVMLLRLNQ